MGARPDFVPFPKISRLNRGCVITEKIDGTNAQIVITDDGDMFAGSRNRWISVGDDNYGFAGWVEAHKADLLKLGPGQHFGEWWGVGIQRGYGLYERRFSLFNTRRWNNPESGRPECCLVVPVIYAGLFTTNAVNDAIAKLKTEGSVAAPGFMDPEGVVVFHAATRTLQKVTCKSDESRKSEAGEA